MSSGDGRVDEPADGLGGADEAARGRCTRDREAEVTAVRLAEIRQRLAGLVTAGVIDEHRLHPVGNHSPALAELLHYFRQAPTAGKLAALAVEPGRSWQVVRLSGTPGQPHDATDATRFDSPDAVAHEVFVRRLAELGWPVADG